jgi:energy-coupling factor transport system ATP-binding protein
VGRALRGRVGVILQDPASQLFCASAAEELALAARNLDMAEDRIVAAIARRAHELALEGELEQRPHELSAGRQQMLLLGAALIAGPELLIADEPAAHMDPAARACALAAIRREVDAGLAVIWVTQDDQERAAADRVLWLGERTASGPLVRPRSAPPGRCALRLSIAAWSGGAGPAIRVPAAISIDLPAAGSVVLSGPNGCGKSVLLAAATGAAESSQCIVKWEVEPDLPSLLVSQNPDQQIFEELVEDELVYAAVRRGLGRRSALAAARTALEKLGLPADHMLRRRCWWLSGGEKRLIEAVAGLIAPAGLLALDEPSAGLDEQRRAALAELIRERSERGPVLVATQDAPWGALLGGAWIELGVSPASAGGQPTRLVPDLTPGDAHATGRQRTMPSLSKKTD